PALCRLTARRRVDRLARTRSRGNRWPGPARLVHVGAEWPGAAPADIGVLLRAGRVYAAAPPGYRARADHVCYRRVQLGATRRPSGAAGTSAGLDVVRSRGNASRAQLIAVGVLPWAAITEHRLSRQCPPQSASECACPLQLSWVRPGRLPARLRLSALR